MDCCRFSIWLSIKIHKKVRFFIIEWRFFKTLTNWFWYAVTAVKIASGNMKVLCCSLRRSVMWRFPSSVSRHRIKCILGWYLCIEFKTICKIKNIPHLLSIEEWRNQGSTKPFHFQVHRQGRVYDFQLIQTYGKLNGASLDPRWNESPNSS